MKPIKKCVKWEYHCPRCRSLLYGLIKCPSCGQDVEYGENLENEVAVLKKLLRIHSEGE